MFMFAVLLTLGRYMARAAKIAKQNSSGGRSPVDFLERVEKAVNDEADSMTYLFPAERATATKAPLDEVESSTDLLEGLKNNKTLKRMHAKLHAQDETLEKMDSKLTRLTEAVAAIAGALIDGKACAHGAEGSVSAPCTPHARTVSSLNGIAAAPAAIRGTVSFRRSGHTGRRRNPDPTSTARATSSDQDAAAMVEAIETISLRERRLRLLMPRSRTRTSSSARPRPRSESPDGRSISHQRDELGI